MFLFFYFFFSLKIPIQTLYHSKEKMKLYLKNVGNLKLKYFKKLKSIYSLQNRNFTKELFLSISCIIRPTTNLKIRARRNRVSFLRSQNRSRQIQRRTSTHAKQRFLFGSVASSQTATMLVSARNINVVANRCKKMRARNRTRPCISFSSTILPLPSRLMHCTETHFRRVRKKNDEGTRVVVIYRAIAVVRCFVNNVSSTRYPPPPPWRKLDTTISWQ